MAHIGCFRVAPCLGAEDTCICSCAQGGGDRGYGGGAGGGWGGQGGGYNDGGGGFRHL